MIISTSSEDKNSKLVSTYYIASKWQELKEQSTEVLGKLTFPFIVRGFNMPLKSLAEQMHKKIQDLEDLRTHLTILI